MGSPLEARLQACWRRWRGMTPAFWTVAKLRETQWPSAQHTEEQVCHLFCPVTLHEDIKKQFQVSKRENSFLKNKMFGRNVYRNLIRWRKLCSVKQRQVNKGYHASRKACINKISWRTHWNKMNKANQIWEWTDTI